MTYLVVRQGRWLSSSSKLSEMKRFTDLATSTGFHPGVARAREVCRWQGGSLRWLPQGRLAPSSCVVCGLSCACWVVWAPCGVRVSVVGVSLWCYHHTLPRSKDHHSFPLPKITTVPSPLPPHSPSQEVIPQARVKSFSCPDEVETPRASYRVLSISSDPRLAQLLCYGCRCCATHTHKRQKEGKRRL